MSVILERLASLRKSPTTRDSRLGSDGSVTTPPALGSPEDKYIGLALLLVQKAQLGRVFSIFRSRLEQATAEQLVEAKKRPDAHTDSQLIQLAKHACTITWVQRALAVLDGEIEQRREKGQSESELEPYVSGVLSSVGLVLAQGFDKVESAKLLRDAAGNVVGINDPRQSECDKALKRGETLLGGKRKKRQTKKKSMKKRKTLRRVRH